MLALTTGASVADLNQSGTDAYRRGDYTVAERLFREAVRRAPRDPVSHYHLGVSLAGLSRWREAAEAFQTVLRLNPSPEIASAAREGLRNLAPVTTRSSRPVDEGPEVVPLRGSMGTWTAEVLLNERQRAHFLVDTGASVSVISPRLAAALGIRPDPDAEPIVLQTLGGRVSGHLVKIPSVRVGEIEARDVVAVIHPTGDSMDGILGNSFLGRYNTRLDPKRRVLSLEPR